MDSSHHPLIGRIQQERHAIGCGDSHTEPWLSGHQAIHPLQELPSLSLRLRQEGGINRQQAILMRLVRHDDALLRQADTLPQDGQIASDRLRIIRRVEAGIHRAKGHASADTPLSGGEKMRNATAPLQQR